MRDNNKFIGFKFVLRKIIIICAILQSCSMTILFMFAGCEPDLIFEPRGFIGGYGSKIGQFRLPKGIHEEYIANLGRTLFVADYGNNRVQAISSDRKDQSYTFGEQGSDPGQFNGPVSVAISRGAGTGSISDSQIQRIYVTDSKNNRIQKFDIDGNFILSWGESGGGPGQFDTPTGIDIDYAGRIYVVDSGNNRIQVFDTLGNFIQMWGQYGQDSGRFDGPIDLAVVFDYDTWDIKYIAVTDYGNNRVQLFDTIGTLLSIIANLNHPLGVACGYSSILICGGDKYVTKYRTNDGHIDREGIGEMGAPYDITGYTFISDQATHRIYDYSGLF
jgi:DNA-binding beta-propeller fold protein YncE